ncbi:MAG: cupin domain-containing protein [Candidatus Methanofastidiosia archaeon]
MLIKNERDLKGLKVSGDRGEAVLKDFFTEDLVFGTRIIKMGSVVPKKLHKHKEKQINYIVYGEGEVTNGKETKNFKKGDFILFDSGEEHYFTAKAEIHAIELKF